MTAPAPTKVITNKFKYVVRLRFPSTRGAKFDLYDLIFCESLIEAKAVAFASFVIGGIPASVISISQNGGSTNTLFRFGYGDVTKDEALYIERRQIPKELEKILDDYRFKEDCET